MTLESLDAWVTGGGASVSESLTVPMTYIPAKTAEVLELDMGDGIILYNHGADLVHSLNPTAAVIWQLCDGDASVRDLADEIAEAYALDVRELEEQLVLLIAEFDALGLVRDIRSEGR